MMNFLFGTLAGGTIACVATIAAARNPEVQVRLGLVAPVPVFAPTVARPENRCPAIAKADLAHATPADADMLFARRRFWFVAPPR